MKRVHLILTGLSATIILLSLNRLTHFTQGHLQPYDFLRWLDFNAMLPIPLLSILLYYLLRREVIYQHSFLKTRLFVFFSLLFISGVYFFGAGSGDHEITNYLNFRFCDSGKVNSSLCKIISYNDDEFSHIIYYIGFISMNASLMLTEYFLPRKKTVSRKDLFLVGINSLFIALGIFANLAFEEARLDLIFFSSVMILSLYLLFFAKRKYNQLPITFYFAVSYTVGIASTLVYKLL